MLPGERWNTAIMVYPRSRVLAYSHAPAVGQGQVLVGIRVDGDPRHDAGSRHGPVEASRRQIRVQLRVVLSRQTTCDDTGVARHCRFVKAPPGSGPLTCALLAVSARSGVAAVCHEASFY